MLQTVPKFEMPVPCKTGKVRKILQSKYVMYIIIINMYNPYVKLV